MPQLIEASVEEERPIRTFSAVEVIEFLKRYREPLLVSALVTNQHPRESMTIFMETAAFASVLERKVTDGTLLQSRFRLEQLDDSPRFFIVPYS